MGESGVVGYGYGYGLYLVSLSMCRTRRVGVFGFWEAMQRGIVVEESWESWQGQRVNELVGEIEIGVVLVSV